MTINGTITGDASSYSVTFEVRGTTTFGGTTPAQAPIGTAGIECKITKVGPAQ